MGRASTSHIQQRRISRHNNPSGVPVESFFLLLLMITSKSIFFFVNLEGFSWKENAWWERSVLAAAQLPQPRDLWKCFSRLSEQQKVKISMKLWKMFIMSGLCNIQRKNSRTEPAISQQLGTQNEPNCATFVVRRLNSTSIVKTWWEIEVKKIETIRTASRWIKHLKKLFREFDVRCELFQLTITILERKRSLQNVLAFINVSQLITIKFAWFTLSTLVAL